MIFPKRVALVVVLLFAALAGCLPAGVQDDATLVCIREHESANLPNPWAAYNPDGPYYGAYQWLQSSWDTAVVAVGRPELVGRHPIEPDVGRTDQDAVTLAYHRQVGDGPWGNRC